MPVGYLHVFFGKMSLQVFCPFLNWVGFFWGILDIELYELFTNFRYQLICCIICKYFLPIIRLSFHFVYDFLCCTNLLSLIGGGGLVAKLCPTLATPWTIASQPPLSMGIL